MSFHNSANIDDIDIDMFLDNEDEPDTISQEEIDILNDFFSNEHSEENIGDTLNQTEKDKREKRLLKMKEYQKSQKYRDIIKKYQQTQKYKDIAKKYRERPENKERMKKLQLSQRYIDKRNEYFKSEKCKLKKQESYRIRKEKVKKIIEDLANKHDLDEVYINKIVKNINKKEYEVGLTEPEIQIRNEYITEYRKQAKRQKSKDLRTESSQYLRGTNMNNMNNNVDDEHCDDDDDDELLDKGGKRKFIRKKKTARKKKTQKRSN